MQKMLIGLVSLATSVATMVLANTVVPARSPVPSEEVLDTRDSSYVISSVEVETPNELSVQNLTESEEILEDTKDESASTKYYDIPLSEALQDKVVYYLDYMGIELDASYVYALIYCESRFDPYATGDSGDSGYCQLLQRYFDYFYSSLEADYPDLVAEENLPYDVYNEKTNLACGIYYLNKCAEEISGTGVSQTNLSSALTSYNRGVGGAQEYFNNNGTYVTDYSSNVIEVAHYLQENNNLPSEY